MKSVGFGIIPRIWLMTRRGLGHGTVMNLLAQLTANGEIFDPEKVTAAHKTLPMPSVVQVTNLDNGRSLVVQINDRGPFVAGRIIDLSRVRSPSWF